MFLSEHQAALAAGVSALAGTPGTWRLSVTRINACTDDVRLGASAEAVITDAAERAAFLAVLNAELIEMRRSIKDCETNGQLSHDRCSPAPDSCHRQNR